MQLLVILLGLVTAVFAFRFLGNTCFDRALRLLSRMEKHMPFGSFDSCLPLRGRWLRYVTAVLLTMLGLVALLLAGLAVWWLLMSVLLAATPA